MVNRIILQIHLLAYYGVLSLSLSLSLGAWIRRGLTSSTPVKIDSGPPSRLSPSGSRIRPVMATTMVDQLIVYSS